MNTEHNGLLAVAKEKNLNEGPSMTPDKQAEREEAYEAGWRTCANWMNRDDLISDIGSPAYVADMQKSLSHLSGAQKDMAPAAAEAPTVDVGGLEYKGNSVSHWHTKAKAYGDTVLKVWQMLADAGYLDPSKRENHIEDMLRAALASQPKADSTEAKQAADAFASDPEWKAQPLTEAQINAICAMSEEGNWDDEQFVRAIEEFHGIASPTKEGGK